MVPKMMHNTMTNDIKTAIFARLRFNAFPKLALSPMNRVSFKIQFLPNAILLLPGKELEIVVILIL